MPINHCSRVKLVERARLAQIAERQPLYLEAKCQQGEAIVQVHCSDVQH